MVNYESSKKELILYNNICISKMKVTIDSFIVHVGKSAKENWELFDEAEPTDIWFHLDDCSSPYIILELPENTQLTKDTIIKCAKLCKSHSKEKNSTRSSVIYCPIKNLKKGKTMGTVFLHKTPEHIFIYE